MLYLTLVRIKRRIDSGKKKEKKKKIKGGLEDK
jgi:hypothetical protein